MLMLCDNSFKLAAIKLVTPPREQLEKHYADLAEKPFFPGLVTCQSSTAFCTTSVGLPWNGKFSN
jgi:nucleoside-diphosphate kinase